MPRRVRRLRPKNLHGKEEVEGSSPSKLFGGSHCSVPALPVEAVKDIELAHGTGPNRPTTTARTHNVDASAAVSIGARCPPGIHAVQNARLLPQPCSASETAVEPKSLQITRFMAPGGSQAACKSA